MREIESFVYQGFFFGLLGLFGGVASWTFSVRLVGVSDLPAWAEKTQHQLDGAEAISRKTLIILMYLASAILVAWLPCGVIHGSVALPDVLTPLLGAGGLGAAAEGLRRILRRDSAGEDSGQVGAQGPRGATIVPPTAPPSRAWLSATGNQGAVAGRVQRGTNSGSTSS